jgi:biopolymer transport protein ExbB
VTYPFASSPVSIHPGHRAGLAATLLGLALLVGGPAAAAGEADTTLEKAYRREFAYIEAERRELDRQLAAVDADEKIRGATFTREIEALEGRLLTATTRADALTAELADAERAAQGGVDDADAVEAVFAQAATSLAGFKPDATADAAAKTGLLATAAVAALDASGQVTVKDGRFFDTGGVEIAGQLVQIGRVATLAASDSVAGTLAPAGGGRLKLWPDDAAAAARAVAQGQTTPTVSLFLYESLDKPVEKRAEQSVAEHIDSGGIIAWVIAVLGAFTALLLLIRWIVLWRAAAVTRRLAESVVALVESGRAVEARAQVADGRSGPARLLRVALDAQTRPAEEADNLVGAESMRVWDSLDRFRALIGSLAAIAPLLGLLGTVTGMIATFDLITEFGTSDPKLLSGGISEALITTELGLIVAIPALLLGNTLSTWARGTYGELTRAALHINNLGLLRRDE